MSPEQAQEALGECRRRIDELDRRILALLNERTGIVEQIGRLKTELAMPIYEPRREDEVFRNVVEHNQGPLSGDALKRIYERILDEMRSLQRMGKADAGDRDRPKPSRDSEPETEPRPSGSGTPLT